ncbi:MAG: TRAP transporter small permease [Alphaproteobacteria bacterium]|uniref:TRAP transporter small permease protein n=1 Tax=Peteryoungia algae TaxID=2919917 RepID=A0ABT0CWC1_9HYPH|nr:MULTISPECIES: TRAP transporter small permease [unclassified Rhizobium]MBU2328521.1 TRAP transporter small permease [Alphaproteobacteria bacterium]MCC8931493.1 TRAP transporter small permease [Rhizobium sp. 'Codium 1']MCJ8237254.1 TRAP transporter small permease [Rhizobium sp. SSM4.3]
MSRFMQAIRPGLRWLSLACLYLAGTGLVLMTLIIGWQVFGRYVLNDTPSWSEPLSLQLMSWFILLGAAVGVRESVHLGLDIVRYNMSLRVQRLMDLVSLGLICIFGGAMSYYGTQLAAGTWTARIPVLGWPGGIDFIPLIAGGALISIFALERLIDTFIAPVAAMSDDAANAEVL